MVHSVCAFLWLAQSAAFGNETVGLYNATSSQFYLKNRHAGGAAGVSFGFGPRRNNWLPLSGDWDGDDMDTVGLFNPATSHFYLQNAHEGGSADISFAFGPRAQDWLPLSGDWDVTDDMLRLDYEGFTVWLDCERRGAVKFRYNAQRDTGNQPRSSRFYLDPDVPARCQQTSSHSYSHPEQRYDRGHLVPANHLDYSETAIKQSNTMTPLGPGFTRVRGVNS